MNKNNQPEKLYEDCHAMGGMSKYAYADDPKRLAFTLARYKHTAKLLEGKSNVLEVGCSDGFGSRIVRQHVSRLTAIDLDEKAIIEARAGAHERWPIDFRVGTPYDAKWETVHFDAVYCLDVIEHIHPDDHFAFVRQLARIAPVAVVGTPSLESQAYASRLSREGHINCRSGADLRESLELTFKHVFMFSMNDEALGTGFLPMAHYLLALCVR